MKRPLSLLFICLLAIAAGAQSDIFTSLDPAEIRLYKNRPADSHRQQELREGQDWQEFLDGHGTWYVHFNERTGLPHRAYGEPIDVAGNTPHEKGLAFFENQLDWTAFPLGDLQPAGAPIEGKYTWANFDQYYQGLEVIGSRASVKFFNGRVVLFAADVFPGIDLNTQPVLTSAEAVLAAQSGITNTVLDGSCAPLLSVLPVPGNTSFSFHLIYTCTIKTMGADQVPANYQTYVDAHTGEVLMRKNTVAHICTEKCLHSDPIPANPANLPCFIVEVNLTGDVYPYSPYDAIETAPMRNIEIVAGGDTYTTDENGHVVVNETPGTTAQVRLMGPWSRVYTNGTTPVFSFMLADGVNNQSFNANANIKERSAYKSVNEIHDHHKAWMSGFDGMDFQLPTNVDVAGGTCNAFYDGSSINFYDIGGGCNATSQIADVVYHEYGHGINDTYYQSEGSFFVNGAMGEGYADFWAISLTNNPVLGSGFYTDSQDGIRRYDIDPKVYPEDLVGEVHADGEIIMGAWWDSHLLMGADWSVTMPLFVETYAGLQAEAMDGNEGDAYTDVLIDALMADDDDGDITNGTPNAEAIIEGFAIHGITLLSNASLYHNDLEFADAQEDIEINATLSLEFDFIPFMQDVSLHYRLNNESLWNTAPLINTGGTSYQAMIPAQPKGTVIAYYLSTTDVFGYVSNVQPIASNYSSNANLPYYILVGVQVEGRHDCDDYEDWGAWQEGIAGDNAESGEWVFDEPVGSYGDDGSMVQIEFQHTPGGEFCFVTGNAAPADGIGTNDVDSGKSTMQTSVIDLTEYENPVIAYWRYYTNSPPSGANPGADWWQVRISDDNGSSWTYIENTLTDDMSWRRHAFRVLDYVDATASVRMQFIASDSTTIGENLDGGSLIEAAVDDFVLYDNLIAPSVEETENGMSLEVFPNPAQTHTWVDFELPVASNIELNLFDATGRLVWVSDEGMLGRGQHRLRVPVRNLEAGVY
ncbi:MAG: hypothetical protein JNM00_04435, partial [Flavobacteriales bacterium]|nr:hypothetical protein [Flavobacteriales bacterium]